jgi:hypothetical protein
MARKPVIQWFELDDVGKESKYTLFSAGLPDKTPRINEIRREYGWR